MHQSVCVCVCTQHALVCVFKNIVKHPPVANTTTISRKKQGFQGISKFYGAMYIDNSLTFYSSVQTSSD